MTAENLYRLAQSAKLGDSLSFEGYCMTGAIDSCFDHINIPLEVYEANYTAFIAGEIGQESERTDRFYRLLGKFAFMDENPESFMDTPYYFTTLDEFQTDLFELRNKKTILLDVYDGAHSVGLKPYGDNLDEWQIVGTDQIIATSSENYPLDVQGMIEPKVMTSDQVWDYLLSHNSPDASQQNALIFPAEPAQSRLH